MLETYSEYALIGHEINCAEKEFPYYERENAGSNKFTRTVNI